MLEVVIALTALVADVACFTTATERVGRAQLASASAHAANTPIMGLCEDHQAQRLAKLALPEGSLATQAMLHVQSPSLGVQHAQRRRAAHAVQPAESHPLHTSAAGTQRSKSVVRDLTSQAEIDDALQASRVTGRLAVIKFYSPACAMCLASAPKFRRLAVAHAAVHDFYQARPRSPPD